MGWVNNLDKAVWRKGGGAGAKAEDSREADNV